MLHSKSNSEVDRHYVPTRVPYLMFLEWLTDKFGANRLITERDLDEKLRLDLFFTNALFDDFYNWLGHEPDSDRSPLSRARDVLRLLAQNWPSYHAVVIELGGGWAILPTAKALLDEYDRQAKFSLD